MPLSITRQSRLIITQTGTGDFGPAALNVTIENNQAWADGVGAGQANLLFTDERTVASGASDTIDLAGVLQDALGATIAGVELVGLMIVNAPKNVAAPANTTNLTVGAGSNPLVGWLGGTTPTVGPIRPGGVLERFETDAAGMCPITAGTGDILTIANSAGAAATYQIVILARNA